METTDSRASDTGVVRIDDIESFRARVSGRLSPHKLRTLSNERFTSRIWGTSLGELAVLQFSTGARLDVDIPEHLEYFDFVTARQGSALVRSGRQEVEVAPGRSGVILQPGSRVEMRLHEGFDQLHLRIAPATLISSAEQLLGRFVGSKIRFTDARIDLASCSAAWVVALGGVAEDGLRGVSAVPHAMMSRQWAEMLVTSILTTVPNSLAPLFDAPAPRAPNRSLGRATDYIEANLAESMTVAEVAGAAYVSVRALQRSFMESYGTSPLSFIEQRRLAAVRRDLLAATPADTVADCAYRWGFTHLSRFAAAYARKYGELPSATLKTVGAAWMSPAPPHRSSLG